jgi:hypothetical protein
VTAPVTGDAPGTERPSCPVTVDTPAATELSALATSVATGGVGEVPGPGGFGADAPEPEGVDPVGVPSSVAAPPIATCPPGAPRAPDVDAASELVGRFGEPALPDPCDAAVEAGVSVDGAPRVRLSFPPWPSPCPAA